MHFRARNQIVQVIRTAYDPDTKKAKNTIVGRLSRSSPEIGDELRRACSPEELREVQAWIAGQAKTDRLKSEYAARTLGERMAAASEWFQSEPADDSARQLAAEVQRSWAALRGVMRKRGLLD